MPYTSVEAHSSSKRNMAQGGSHMWHPHASSCVVERVPGDDDPGISNGEAAHTNGHALHHVGAGESVHRRSGDGGEPQADAGARNGKTHPHSPHHPQSLSPHHYYHAGPPPRANGWVTPDAADAEAASRLAEQLARMARAQLDGNAGLLNGRRSGSGGGAAPGQQQQPGCGEVRNTLQHQLQQQLQQQLQHQQQLHLRNGRITGSAMGRVLTQQEKHYQAQPPALPSFQSAPLFMEGQQRPRGVSLNGGSPPGDHHAAAAPPQYILSPAPPPPVAAPAGTYSSAHLVYVATIAAQRQAQLQHQQQAQLRHQQQLQHQQQVQLQLQHQLQAQLQHQLLQMQLPQLHAPVPGRLPRHPSTGQLLGSRSGGGASAGGGCSAGSGGSVRAPVANGAAGPPRQQQHSAVGGAGPRQQGLLAGSGPGSRLPSRGSSPSPSNYPSYRDRDDVRRGGGASPALPQPSPPPSAAASAAAWEPAHTSDLERFILQVTPMLALDASLPADEALADLCVDSVWRFFEDHSVYGREVYTLGGARGPSMCYFVPYLSAIQLFEPADPPAGSADGGLSDDDDVEGARWQAGGQGHGQGRMYTCDTMGWPRHMRLRFEHFETAMPFNRTPLYEHIEQLAEAEADEARMATMETGGARDGASGAHVARQAAAKLAAAAAAAKLAGVAASAHTSAPASMAGSPGACCASALGTPPPPQPASSLSSPSAGPCDGAGARAASEGSAPPGSFLRTAKVADLHPASWFSVAWYPVYRIPEAPLCARFLTFHSFAPLVVSMERARNALREGLSRPVAIMPLQVVGLKWYNMHGERWLEGIADSGDCDAEPGAEGAAADQWLGGSSGAGGSDAERAARASEPSGSFSPLVPRRCTPPLPKFPHVMDAAWASHLRDLQGTAERLSRGAGLHVLGPYGPEEPRQRHPDFEFFNARG
ncbi:hypothetical protein FOA52_011083 [Chlamydomonas sp. UWO 241]|nr:hypothetical protein FOA52_011083 [Chlamydomonas sp. UWO 241]